MSDARWQIANKNMRRILSSMGFWDGAWKDIVVHGSRMNITESCLDRHAGSGRVALSFEHDDGTAEKYTYARLLEEACRFSNLLSASNVKEGSRIFIFLPKSPEIFITLLGTIRHGSIAAPLFEAFQKDGLMLRLKSGEAEVLVTNTELAGRLPDGIKKAVPSLKEIFIVDSDAYKKRIGCQPATFKPVMKGKADTALMIFTSSTAGTPVAGVELPHQALVQQHASAKHVLGLTPEDRYWCTAHPGWVTGSVYGILAPLSIGCTSFLCGGRFDSGKWIRFIKGNKISVLYTAPTALRMLKGEVKKGDLSGLKSLCSVGEALTTAVFDFYKALGIEINDTYWQTETGAIMSAGTNALKKKAGAIGKALPGVTASIREGCMAFKPGWPSMMTGIYRHKAMYEGYFKKGWFMTNDMASVDPEGYFFFEGRGGDMIKTSGERVSPIEIESALMKHKAVQEAAVIGVPDETKGEAIKAFIVLNSGFKPSAGLKEELASFAKKSYAGHSYPREIEFVSSLPKTNSGKIIRMELRRLEGSGKY